MQHILLAFGLAIVIEGLVYALAPSFLDRLLSFLRTLSIPERRRIGLIAIALGATLVWVSLVAFEF